MLPRYVIRDVYALLGAQKDSGKSALWQSVRDVADVYAMLRARVRQEIMERTREEKNDRARHHARAKRIRCPRERLLLI